MNKILLFPLLFIAFPAFATQPVYSYKDSNGNIVYTNTPPNSTATPIELTPLQSIASQKLTNDTSKVTNNQSIPLTISIEGIPDDETLRTNNGNFSITVKTNGSANTTFQYRLLLDGKQYGTDQSAPSFTLNDIDRGTHTIQAQLIQNGQVITSSNTESFTIQRVNLNSPARHQPKPR